MFVYLNSVSRFAHGLLGFLLGVGLAIALCFPTRVLGTLALASTYGSLTNSLLGHRAEIGIARIGMSPSNPGMGKIKLSSACIQMHKI
jgi:hypothetical protein